MKLSTLQQRGIMHLLDRQKGAALFFKMGLGKTRTTLEAMARLPREAFPVLVVAPKRVCQTVWESEAAKWGVPFTFSHILGDEKQRLAGANADANVFLVNPENLVWLVEQGAWRWPTVVVDESSMFRAPGAKRVKALTRMRAKLHGIWLLSGTPSPNGYLGLFAQLRLIDGGQRLGTSFERYKRRFFDSDFRGFNWWLKDGAKEEIDTLIADVCLAATLRDYVDLPPVIIAPQRVVLPQVAREVYEQVKADLAATLPAGEKLLAATAAAGMNKLAQIASGTVYLSSSQTRDLHDAKLDAIDELLDADAAPLAVAAWYKPSRRRLRERFPFAVDMGEVSETSAVKAQWDAGRIRLLIMPYGGAAHGLNLQAGGYRLALFDPVWDLELHEQIIARLDRTGQTERVCVYPIVAEGTVDEQILAAQASKASVQEMLLEALK
jgi:SNF2 family DNA or RNA helicase